MGETDEFVPKSLHAEDETPQEPAAEESAVPTTYEPVEPSVEQPDDGLVETAVQPVVDSAEPTAEEPVVVDQAQAETAGESASDEPDAISVALQDAPAEPDELDEISRSLVDEGASEEGDANAEDAQIDGDQASPTAADSGSDSFDDIAPPAPEVAAVSQVPGPNASADPVPWWPFLVYLGAWVVLAAAAVWQLLQLPADQVVYESTAYVLTILGGLIMTAMGPLLILAVWLGTRANRSAQERQGLLTSALLKGALVTLIGAIIWWASLVIIDYLRLGRLL